MANVRRLPFFLQAKAKKQKTKRKQQTSPLTRGLVGPRLYITICHLDMCDQSQVAEDEMYQSACCLVNWAEVSRRHVSAKQRKKIKRNRVLESARPRLCCVGFEQSPWIRWGGRGGVGGCRSHRHPRCAARWERL